MGAEHVNVGADVPDPPPATGVPAPASPPLDAPQLAQSIASATTASDFDFMRPPRAKRQLQTPMTKTRL